MRTDQTSSPTPRSRPTLLEKLEALTPSSLITWNLYGQNATRPRGEELERLRYATTETLRLSSFLLEALPAEDWKGHPVNLIHEIEEEAAVRRSRTGSQPLGIAAIRVNIPTILRRRVQFPKSLFSRSVLAESAVTYLAYLAQRRSTTRPYSL
jgi:hypothetical protein